MNKKTLLVSALSILAMSGCNNPTSSEPISYDSIISESEDSSSGSTTSESSSTATSSEITTSSGGTSTNSSGNVSSSESSSSTSSTSSSSSSSSSTSIGVTTSSESSSEYQPPVNNEFIGVDNVTIAKGQYFNPFEGVSIYDVEGNDRSSEIKVKGHVDYSKIGSYTLTYSIDGKEASRIVTISDQAISRKTYSKTYTNQVVQSSKGSWRTGDGSSMEAIPPSPSFLEGPLSALPVPTSSWWTSMLINNYGGSNGIYSNPLRTSFTNNGVELSNPDTGFTQYWTDADNALSVAQFSITLKDITLKSNDLNEQYQTRVIDYSDNSVKIAMRNSPQGQDEMVITQAQGSPYLFAEMMSKNGHINLPVAGTTKPYEFYDLSGQAVTESYQGDALVIKIPQLHVGFNCAIPTGPNQTIPGAPIYKDKYYIVNAPSNTTFSISREKHDNEIFKDRISFTLGDSNYLSIASIKDLSEAAYYHEHGYSIIHRSYTNYKVDHENSEVITNYNQNYQEIKSNNVKPLIGLLQHQYKYSSNALTSYGYDSVRGRIKILEGERFSTKQAFNGMLPTYTLPTNAGFSLANVNTYLTSLDGNTNSTYGDTDENRKGPYWDAKTFYPLAQGVIMADQAGKTSYKQTMLSKLEGILEDWFTYSGTEDESYLYYDQRYGTMYYSNNDFSTASEMSDHHFTHGYLIYAASVASMYDETFYNDYKGVIDSLLSDYMNPNRDSADYPYLRTFDPWAGHSWAHGYGSFTEGNNQESSGEALNSWVAGYMIGLKEQNQEKIDAAIYGYTTELNALKQYIFDYDNDIFPTEYSSVVNISSILWAGKNTYATWFGLNPSFIYGIHYLPLGEYVSGYAIGNKEKAKLTEIYNKYLSMKTSFKDTWMANMWSVEALTDADSAIAKFDASKILNDDYPNDLLGAYWNINAIKSLGDRTEEVVVSNSPNVAWDVYKNASGKYVGQVWNSSSTSQTVTFVSTNGTVLKTVSVAAGSFERIAIN